MMRTATILVTGGAGFIGSNFIRYLFGRQDFAGTIVNVDCLTYAGNARNLADIAADPRYSGRYVLEPADIRDPQALAAVFERHQPNLVVHLAAESHVDRSIVGPQAFVETNVNGTFNLLELCRSAEPMIRFHHVSTDEVFGSLGPQGSFTESTAYDPRSPYSATKAASDHLVRAYHHTYGLPVTISNCSNNYGPYHFPEKLIPVMILKMLEKQALPVYGDGRNIRDWLYVEDHAAALWLITQQGTVGETYAIGGGNEWENIRLVNELCDLVSRSLSRRSWPHPLAGAWVQPPSPTELRGLIAFVPDRPGHDRRYAIDASKLRRELGWAPSLDFAQGLQRTVDWYLDHPDWVTGVRDGSYRDWMATNYAHRGSR